MPSFEVGDLVIYENSASVYPIFYEIVRLDSENSTAVIRTILSTSRVFEWTAFCDNLIKVSDLTNLEKTIYLADYSNLGEKSGT